MTPTKPNTNHLIRYSPRPLSDYRQVAVTSEIGPATSQMLTTQGAWNLAYLSYDYDKSLQHPDPYFTVNVKRSTQVRLDGSGLDIAQEYGVEHYVESWLHLPAPRFVHLITNSKILVDLPIYKAYGKQWLDTIHERSFLCQTHENPPDNIVDFSAARAVLKGLMK